MILMRTVSHFPYDNRRMFSYIMLDYTRYYEQLQNSQFQPSLEKADETPFKAIAGDPNESDMHEVSVDE